MAAPPADGDSLAWMGVDLPESVRGKLLERWNKMSDEEKVKAREKWNGMPEEERQKAVEVMQRM